MKLRGEKGFTLIEVIVVAAIIAVLAGIIIPLIFKEIDNAKIARAQADVKSIQSAIAVFKKDTGKWPMYVMGGGGTPKGNVTLLVGDGSMPADSAANGFDPEVQNSFAQHLSNNSAEVYDAVTWKGPYIAAVSADPWGNAYISNVKQFNDTYPVWIVSGGPNGRIDTGSGSEVLLGDDIGIRIK